MPFPPDTELVHILDTFNQADMALIKSILDAERIPYLFQGEYSASSVYHIIPIRLMVPSEHAERARDVLEQLDLNVGQVNLTDAQFDENDDVPDQETDQANEIIPEEAQNKERPVGLSMEWALIDILVVPPCSFISSTSPATILRQSFMSKQMAAWRLSVKG